MLDQLQVHFELAVALPHYDAHNCWFILFQLITKQDLANSAVEKNENLFTFSCFHHKCNGKNRLM